MAAKLTDKVYALKMVGRHLGMFGKSREPPVIDDSVRFTCLICVAVIQDPARRIESKMAAALILDFYIPEWRSIAGPEVVGNVLERESREVSQWKKRVLERDGYRCVECGSHDSLEVHHIAHWAEFPELRIVDENGETLCNDCHADQHENLANLIRSRRRCDHDNRRTKT